MPRKYTKRKKTGAGRQGLDWTNPKSFETAAKRLMKTYNSYLGKGLDPRIVEDQLKNLKEGLGHMKVFDSKSRGYRNDPNDDVFGRLFVTDKNGKLTMRTYKPGEKDLAQEVYELQASKNKVKTVDKGGKAAIVEDRTQQRLRVVYESTHTYTQYMKSVSEDVAEGYSDFSLDEAEREVLKPTIKGTAAEIMKHNPNVDDKEAYARAKQIVHANSEAVQKEMLARVQLKENDAQIDELFKNISEAIENGLLEGDELGRAMDLAHHAGAMITYADLNELQGIMNRTY